MTSLEEAIRTAHGAEIASIYKNFSSELATAQGNEQQVQEAEDRLRKALAHAAEVLSRVRSIAKLG